MMIKNILRYFTILIMALLPYLNTSVLHAHIYDSLELQTITIFSGTQATVSSQLSDSADFLTLKLAIDAGHNAIRVVGDTTETAEALLTPDVDYLIVIDANVSLDFASFNLLYASTGAGSFEQRLFMRGQGKIKYTFTSIDNRLFKRNGRSVILDVSGLTIQNDSTADDCSISDADVIIMHNIFFDLPGQDLGGITASDDVRNRVDGLTFFGGTFSTSRALSIPRNGIYSNLIFKGDLLNNQPFLEVTTTGFFSGTIIDGLNIDDTTSATQALVFNFIGLLSNFHCNRGAGGQVTLTIGEDRTVINNVVSNRFAIDVDDSKFCKFSNMAMSTTGASIDLSNASADNNNFQNCTFNDLNGLAGNRNKFVNCTIRASTVDITISGDNNIFTNCHVGFFVSGGGTLGFVITGTADSTIIGNSMLDVAVSDSGTNTSLANNVIY